MPVILSLSDYFFEKKGTGKDEEGRYLNDAVCVCFQVREQRYEDSSMAFGVPMSFNVRACCCVRDAMDGVTPDSG